MKKKRFNVWFTADTHFSHKSILFHQPNRVSAMGLKDDKDIKGHDSYLFKMWESLVKKGDHVFVLGDFILADHAEAIKALHRLKATGCIIHLVVGNHDVVSSDMHCLLSSIDFVKCVPFHKSDFPFLDDTFIVSMCHYPMKTWPGKSHGALHAYGHCHNNAQWIDAGQDLCVNVGIDTNLAAGKLISLEQLYGYYKAKLAALQRRAE